MPHVRRDRCGNNGQTAAINAINGVAGSGTGTPAERPGRIIPARWSRQTV